MKLEYRYVLRKDEYFSEKIIRYLINNNVNYKDSNLIVVEFCNDVRYANELIGLFNKYNERVNSIKKVFSNEELSQAKWLDIRSVYRVGYPQPENTFATYNLTYIKNGICSNCEYGIAQSDSFYINKIPKWKDNRNFFQLNWITDELFLSNYAQKVFKDNNLNGIEYWPVKLYKKNELVEDVKQIKIKTILDKGLLVTENDAKKIIKCRECGLPSYLMNGEAILTFKKEIFNENLDFYKTYEIFGEVVTGRRIIVSDKVYRTITENQLDKNLVFEPIKLV